MINGRRKNDLKLQIIQQTDSKCNTTFRDKITFCKFTKPEIPYYFNNL